MKKLLVSCLIIIMLISTAGCSGKIFTSEKPTASQNLADNAIVVAGTFLDILNGFYSVLLAQKKYPDNLVTATQALSMADNAATILRYAKAGGNVTNEQLNTATGQVLGAKAMLAKMTK